MASRWARYSRFVFELSIGLLASMLSTATVEARPLTLDDRLAAQRVIEQVYWDHRIWPKENPGRKPPLSAVLSDAAIRARVEDTLRKSNALAEYWHRPITAEQLQAELDRMAAHTRDPGLLHELFVALGNDPRLIAETLARQTLVDRLIRNWYANDQRFHGARKKEVEAALATCQTVDCMPGMGGNYREMTWQRKSENAEASNPTPRQETVPLDPEEWESHLSQLAATLGGTSESISPRKMSGPQETPEAFVVAAVLSQGQDELRAATVTWAKVSFDEWWAKERPALAASIEDAQTEFSLPVQTVSACLAEGWSPTFEASAPDERSGHKVVWTGTEMIVWGGWNGSNLSTGGRYNPSTDTWTAMSPYFGPPGGTAVWTGTEIIVWGGSINAYYYNDIYRAEGGRYDPSSDTWTGTSMVNVPARRANHSAVWTGTEMIVWGGDTFDGTFHSLNSGGRFDPSTNTWSSTSTGANLPLARGRHTAVWTGTEMIVWGGSVLYDNRTTSPPLNSGGRFDPSTGSWSPTPTSANVPLARHGHSAVWTGTEMIVWGGWWYDGSWHFLNSGGRFDPSTDTWSPTSTGANVPSARTSHTAVWTGTEMIIWGGWWYDNGISHYLNTGGRYNPLTDTWTVPSGGSYVPPARNGHSAVWTGTEMILWGGQMDGIPGSVERYDPSSDTWILSSIPSPPHARYNHHAVWTGAEMIVWGGQVDASTYLSDGGRYDPSTDSWTVMPAGPEATFGQTVLWTGTEMIVWGGGGWITYCHCMDPECDGLSCMGPFFQHSGARYDPTADAWSTASSMGAAPVARTGHSAVWTGSEMIVWGGAVAHCDSVDGNLDCYAYDYQDGGARYDPSTDTWTSISSGTNAPTPRSGHTAVWTGTKMVIWGGSVYGYPESTGARYDPASDAWSAIAMVNAPTARIGQTTVWTGSEMVVWGGYPSDATACSNTGARYDPTDDVWIPTSTGENVPAGRCGHTAVWTGDSMIVWGGSNSEYLNSGSRYDVSTDTWAETSVAGAPTPRSSHTAVWTGNSMIVWGGYGGAATNTGARYSQETPDMVDDDGDGFSECLGDCNDGNGAISPGAPEICDLLDNDCDGAVDNAPAPGQSPSELIDLLDGTTVLIWTPLTDSTSYDVVRGDLGTLRASGLGAAIQACLANDATQTSLVLGDSPDIGTGFFYLIRGVNCAGPGSYDSGDPSQIGSRDPGIASSPFTCP